MDIKHTLVGNNCHGCVRDYMLTYINTYFIDSSPRDFSESTFNKNLNTES